MPALLVLQTVQRLESERTAREDAAIAVAKLEEVGCEAAPLAEYFTLLCYAALV